MTQPKKATPTMTRPLKAGQGTLDSWTNEVNIATPASSAKVASGRVTKQAGKATSKPTKTAHETNKKSNVKSMMESVSILTAKLVENDKPTDTNPAINVELAGGASADEGFELEHSGDESEDVSDSEEYYPLAGDIDDDDDGPNPWSIPVEKRKKWKKYDTPDKNGRFVGRKLVPWHRPRMMEKLLLHLQYECQREGIALPWAKVVHRMSPGSSGQAALQHLMKSRKVLLREGHMVPPLPGKPGPIHENRNIRGYTRETPKGHNQVVLWQDSPVGDRTQSLIDPSIVRGSGQYRKLELEVKRHAQARLERAIQDGADNVAIEVLRKAATEYKHTPVRKSDGSSNKARRERTQAGKAVDASGSDAGAEIKVSTPVKKSCRSRAKASQEMESGEDVDPADLDSDAEYNPNALKRAKFVRKPTRVRKSIKVEAKSDSEGSTKEEETMVVMKKSLEPMTPVKEAANTPLTPPATGKHLKLKLSPSSLQKFPASAPPKIAFSSLVGLIDYSVKEDRHSGIRGDDDLVLKATKLDDKATMTMGNETPKTGTAFPNLLAVSNSEFQRGELPEDVFGGPIHQDRSLFQAVGELDDFLKMSPTYPGLSWANGGMLMAGENGMGGGFEADPITETIFSPNHRLLPEQNKSIQPMLSPSPPSQFSDPADTPIENIGFENFFNNPFADDIFDDIQFHFS